LLKNGHLLRFAKSMPLAGSPTRRRGKKSLLIRRDTTLTISGALDLVLFEQPERDDVFKRFLVIERLSH